MITISDDKKVKLTHRETIPEATLLQPRTITLKSQQGSDISMRYQPGPKFMLDHKTMDNRAFK